MKVVCERKSWKMDTGGFRQRLIPKDPARVRGQRVIEPEVGENKETGVKVKWRGEFRKKKQNTRRGRGRILCLPREGEKEGKRV